MAIKFKTDGRKRSGLWTMAALLLTTVGCGFPHGRYGGDAMLGQFNRPIAGTPPIFTGSDPGVSPAWDAGSRLGLPSPDVHAKSNPVLERMFIMPTFSGSLGLFGGGSGGNSNSGGIERASGASPSPSPVRRPVPSYVGAHFMQMQTPQVNATAIAVQPSPNNVVPRPYDSHSRLTSGSAIEPATAPKPNAQVVFVKDPRTVVSVEEGQSILQTCGAKSMVMEPQPTGEWRFVCTMGDGADPRRYEAVNNDQIEAVRAVMWQVKNER